MAVSTPLYINQVDYDAESERRGLSGLVAQTSAGTARPGVLGPLPDVNLAGATVKVGAFNAVVSSSKGSYLVAVDSVTDAEGTVGVANATNDRRDLVVLEVLDPDNGSSGTARRGRLRVIPGIAAALPQPPATPSLALRVSEVFVPKGGAIAPSVMVNAPRTAAAGAPIPVMDKADRDTLAKWAGLTVLRLDMNGRMQTWTGDKWYSAPQARVSGGRQESTLVDTGIVSVTSDANGFAGYTLPEPFPTALSAVELTSVYQGGYIGLVHYQLDEGLSSRSRIAVACRAADGSLVKNVKDLRLSYTAWGY